MLYMGGMPISAKVHRREAPPYDSKRARSVNPLRVAM